MSGWALSSKPREHLRGEGKNQQEVSHEYTTIGDAAVTSDSPSNTPIDPRDEQIVELLARRFTHQEIGEQLNISTKTVQRSMRKPELKELMMSRRRAILSETTGRLVELSSDAVGVLGALLASKNPNVQLRAVQLTLGLGRRFHVEDRYESNVEERLERLETLLAADGDDE